MRGFHVIRRGCENDLIIGAWLWPGGCGRDPQAGCNKGKHVWVRGNLGHHGSHCPGKL